MRNYTAVLTVFDLPRSLADDGVTRSELYEVLTVEAPSMEAAPARAKAIYAKQLADIDARYEGVELQLVALFAGECRVRRSDCSGVTVIPITRERTPK